MNQAEPLKIHSFDAANPLSRIKDSRHLRYITKYLRDLDATSIIEESNYFDRDYLSEHSAFYGVSSRGYPNVCRRLHFFSASLTRSQLRSALGGSPHHQKRLQDHYLGFIVLRPTSSAPLGRTVLRWYSDRIPALPRITRPSREYHCHIAGMRFTVTGLGWQQQDRGVSACATIALWTMLHSSALDEHHAIPTTSEITQAAHRKGSLGRRVYPSHGLTINQIFEVVREMHLAPVLIPGDVNGRNINDKGFTKAKFASSCASLLRSGYPVLLAGRLEGRGGHAICAVGFREAAPVRPGPKKIGLQDSEIEYIYLHDDNLGPNVRARIEVGPKNLVKLIPEAPPSARKEIVPGPEFGYSAFYPEQILFAVQEELRISPDTLHQSAVRMVDNLLRVINALLRKQGIAEIGLILSTRFFRVREYLGEELEERLERNQSRLARIRLALIEKVPPMSLHIGLIRIGTDRGPLIDILHDTTDSDLEHPAFAHVGFYSAVMPIVRAIDPTRERFGVPVDGSA